MDNKYQNYLYDLGNILKEYSLEARKDYLEAKGTEDEEFKTGYLMGLHRVLSLMVQQTIGFQICNKEIGLSNFDVDKELLL
jgi:hypothetical protein